MINITKEVKCVIWDLDNTIWDGTLLECDNVKLKTGIKNILEELDSRGILNSIASKNNYDDAMSKLKELGIQHYFLFPEISWSAKSISVEKIRKNLNIGMDAILFIDDQQFELDEVKSRHTDITCLSADNYNTLLEEKRLNPICITEEAKRRRLMYIEDSQRKQVEESFQGPPEKFLESLKLKFVITAAKEEDLKRVEELTIRTNQLNSTGRTYDSTELKSFINSDKHMLLVCELTDIYGSYGKIGLALIEEYEDHLHLRLLLMSCRVISRGVGTILLLYIMHMAKCKGKTLFADFKKTDRNKMMYVTYKFANFEELYEDDEGLTVMKNDLSFIQNYPPYIELVVNETN